MPTNEWEEAEIADEVSNEEPSIDSLVMAATKGYSHNYGMNASPNCTVPKPHCLYTG